MKFKFEILAKTADGMDISIDGDFAIGTPVSVLKADGTKEPAMDGDLVMEDGTIITVKDGKIEAIIEAPESPVEDAAPVEEEEMTAQFDAQASYTALELMFNEMKATLESMREQMASEKTITEERFSSISKAPAKAEEVIINEGPALPSLKALFNSMK